MANENPISKQVASDAKQVASDAKQVASDAGKAVSDASKAMPDVNNVVSDASDALSDASEQARPLTDAAGKLVLASIGGVALAGDALEGILKRMVERGEQSQKEARRRMDKLRAKRPHFSRAGLSKVTDSISDAASVPSSKSDIQGLHDQIAALTAKVDQLSKEKGESALPTPPKSALKP